MRAAFIMFRNVNWLSPLHCNMTCRNIHKLAWIMNGSEKRIVEGSRNFFVFVFSSLKNVKKRHKKLMTWSALRFFNITNTTRWKVKREIMKWHSRTTFIAFYFPLEGFAEMCRRGRRRIRSKQIQITSAKCDSIRWIIKSFQETRFIVQSSIASTVEVID